MSDDKKTESHDEVNSDSPESPKKRKAVRQMLVGGGVIGAAGSQWQSPKMNSVILPAHAQTTDSGGEPGAGTPAPTTAAPPPPTAAPSTPPPVSSVPPTSEPTPSPTDPDTM